MTTALIRRTAKDLAGAFYEGNDVLHDGRATRTEKFRREVTNQKAFIWVYWPKFVPMARLILAHMLTEPGHSQSEKDAIFDALLKDQNFRTDEEELAPSIILDGESYSIMPPAAAMSHHHTH